MSVGLVTVVMLADDRVGRLRPRGPAPLGRVGHRGHDLPDGLHDFRRRVGARVAGSRHLQVDVRASLRRRARTRRVLAFVSCVVVASPSHCVLDVADRFAFWWEAWDDAARSSWGMLSLPLWIPYLSLFVGSVLLVVRAGRPRRTGRAVRRGRRPAEAVDVPSIVGLGKRADDVSTSIGAGDVRRSAGRARRSASRSPSRCCSSRSACCCRHRRRLGRARPDLRTPTGARSRRSR